MIEAVVAMVIMGLITSVIFPVSRIQTARHKENLLRDNLFQLRKALQNHKDKEGEYPKSLLELMNKGYLPRVPREPFGFDWLYRAFGETEFLPFAKGFPTWEVQLFEDKIQDICSSNGESAINGTLYCDW